MKLISWMKQNHSWQNDRSSFFWAVMQKWIDSYGRFGTICRSHLQELRSDPNYQSKQRKVPEVFILFTKHQKIRITCNPAVIHTVTIPYRILILCFRASQYKSNETPTWCNTVQVLFLQGHSTCFGGKRPSSRVFKTSMAATGTGVIVAGKSSHLLIRAGRP